MNKKCFTFGTLKKIHRGITLRKAFVIYDALVFVRSPILRITPVMTKLKRNTLDITFAQFFAFFKGSVNMPNFTFHWIHMSIDLRVPCRTRT